MLGKLNTPHFKQKFHQVKGFFHGAYNHTKSFLNHIDNGVNIAKKVYAIASPLIDKYANEHSNQINNHVVKALGNYENIRNHIVEGDNDLKSLKHKSRSI